MRMLNERMLTPKQIKEHVLNEFKEHFPNCKIKLYSKTIVITAPEDSKDGLTLIEADRPCELLGYMWGYNSAIKDMETNNTRAE